MAPLSKWIDGLQPDGPVSDAARVSLEARLAAVAYWLPLAARQLDDDVEKVHQLRVSTRRAIAALKLYRDWLPRRPARWLTRRLKEIRRAAGAARDLDVLALRLPRELGDAAGELLSPVAADRAAAQPAIVAVADNCARDNRLGERTSRLLAGVRPRGGDARAAEPNFHDWAAVRLSEVADRFFAAMPAGTDDLAALHQFRIQGKRLRYSLELLAPAFGSELRETHYPVVEQLQELLGRINDGVAGGARLRQWRDDMADPVLKERLHRLVERQHEQLHEASADYHDWWTDQRADALRHGLAELADRRAEKSSAEPNDWPAPAPNVEVHPEAAEASDVGQA